MRRHVDLPFLGGTWQPLGERPAADDQEALDRLRIETLRTAVASDELRREAARHGFDLSRPEGSNDEAERQEAREIARRWADERNQ